MSYAPIQGFDWLEQMNENFSVIENAELIELASDAETITGEDATKGVTPAGLQAKVAAADAKGIVELATSAETIVGSDTERALTPAGFLAAVRALAHEVNTAALGTVRELHGQLTASHNAISGGNLVGARGAVVLSGGITAGGAYLYGAQGKLIVTGTMNHEDSRLCAGLSQLDLTGGTLTSGQLSGHWIDIVGGNGAGGGQFNGLRITANKDAKPNAVIYGQLNASYLLDLVTPSGTTMDFLADAGTDVGSAGNADGCNADKVLIVTIDAVPYYIPLFDANATT